MRIVLVSRVYPSVRRGGMSFVCQDRAEALARLGHEVHVFTTGKAPENPSTVPGVWVYHSGPESTYSREFADSAAEGVKSLRPDIVHLESLDSSRPWWVDCGKPVNITLHGFGFGAMLSSWNLSMHVDRSLPFRPNFQKLAAERDLMSKAARIITISEHEQWMAQDPYALSNVKLVRNPISLAFYETPTVDPPARRSFLCAAVAMSGQRRFREARRVGKDEDVAVNIITDSPRESMPGQYDRHSALILPSLYSQGSSLTVDEALSRGRPVIAWAVGSSWHDERPGVIKVTPGDLDGLREAMLGHLPTVNAVTSHHIAPPVNHPAIHADQWLKSVAID